MTRCRIEPRSPGPLANSLMIMPMGRYFSYKVGVKKGHKFKYTFIDSFLTFSLKDYSSLIFFANRILEAVIHAIILF